MDPVDGGQPPGPQFRRMLDEGPFPGLGRPQAEPVLHGARAVQGRVLPEPADVPVHRGREEARGLLPRHGDVAELEAGGNGAVPEDRGYARGDDAEVVERLAAPVLLVAVVGASYELGDGPPDVVPHAYVEEALPVVAQDARDGAAPEVDAVEGRYALAPGGLDVGGAGDAGPGWHGGVTCCSVCRGCWDSDAGTHRIP